MQDDFSVVISCAGMGKRLQISKTKALAQIAGQPIIAWQLSALKWVKDIRVVVGYQASELIEYVKTIRSDVMFVFNHDYENTGTAASYTLGAQGANRYVISLDGDLLVSPKSLKLFIQQKKPLLGVLQINTEEPSYITLDENKCVAQSFGKNSNNVEEILEWSGLCCLTQEQIEHSNQLGLNKGHVYELVMPHLPMPFLEIEAREVDTPADFEKAEQFLNINKHWWSE
jgi:choline kinase